MCILSFMIILLLLHFFLYGGKEGFTLKDPFLDGIRDRFIDPMNHRYINQIDWYRDSPNINLEGALSQPTLTSDDINWSRVRDYDYPKIVGYLSGRTDATKIKSINAL